ncbi:MAG TPA: rRNA maturation RNase YbeY [Vicinamibacteria bacterium]
MTSAGDPVPRVRPQARPRSGSSELVLRNLQRSVKIQSQSFRVFLRRLADELAPEGSSATLVLVGDERMRALNRRFRGFDRATDVLSFPAGNGDVPDRGEESSTGPQARSRRRASGGGGAPPHEEETDYLGDIVISVDTARRQARRRGSTLPRELRVLALHGLLHLLGHDHETDQGEMRRIEYRLRRKLQITRGLGGR